MLGGRRGPRPNSSLARRRIVCAFVQSMHRSHHQTVAGTHTVDVATQGPPRTVRRWIAETPIWARVTLTTVGVLVATVIVGGTGIGVRGDSGEHGSTCGHASGTEMPTTDHNGSDHGSNPVQGTGSSHGG